jgi:hypothetical protein
MDELLELLGRSAVNQILKFGISSTSSYAVQQVSRLVRSVDDRGLRRELKTLQKRLSDNIKASLPRINKTW